MPKIRKIITDTVIMTAVSLLMRTVSVSFNVYLTARIGSAGMGLFQLIITVYALTVTFSCAGVRLATTRVAVEILANSHCSMTKSIRQCQVYALFSGCFIGGSLYLFSDIIATEWLCDAMTAAPLRILAASLPFVAMSNSLSGFFTAVGKVPQYSTVQFIEQCIKIVIVIAILSRTIPGSPQQASKAIVIGMTVSEAASFIMAKLLYSFSAARCGCTDCKKTIGLGRMLRVAVPDAMGTCARSILVTVEHLLIPRGLKKSGSSAQQALAAYGNIHALALPVLLYPSAVLSSLSALLVPELASRQAVNNKTSIEQIVSRVIHITLIFSIGTAGIILSFADAFSMAIYKSDEAADYLKVLAPLIPVMYLDIAVDGMLKGLDQQVYSMRYNIIDSAFCVICVVTLLPIFAVKGYIFILYASEIINFYLSLNRLIKVSEVRLEASDLVKPVICCAAACAVLGFAAGIIKTKAALTLCVSLSAGIYILLLYLCGEIKKEPLKRLLTD